MMFFKSFPLFLVFASGISASSQTMISGQIIDTRGNALAYVNVGIKEKKVGTSSLPDGSFSLSVPSEVSNDTITFSLVGFHELSVAIKGIDPQLKMTIRLIEKVTALDEIEIKGEKLVEKKYGIKNRGLIHFTDGIFRNNDSFEIGQVVRLGDKKVQVSSVNLHVNATRPDSASFRINFYGYDESENRPKKRLVEKNILQRKPIRYGWLTFDLTKYNILLKGRVFVSIEFIPERKDSLKQILYEVKIGGTTKSFFRRNSLGQWSSPPHHYCLYVTALVDKNTPDEPADVESVPATILKSAHVPEPYNIFVRLPASYGTDMQRKYPVVYLLDGNAYFDAVNGSIGRLLHKKKIDDAILVGIGYQNAYVMDSLRNRDYTFPEAPSSDSFTISGGGERFYEFIKEVLQPYITRTYNTDTTNRTLMGHSLGGYFVLFSLLNDTKGVSAFDHYVAASPSLWYADYYVLEQLKNLNSNSGVKKRAYLSMGELEASEEPGNQLQEVGRMLSQNGFINSRVKVYEGMEHMGTAIQSFEDGLEFILASSITKSPKP